MSAFGVEDTRISKADSDRPPKASAGRIASGALASPYHGLVAGKPGKKLRAAGNELGGGVLGGVGGRIAGTVLTRGKPVGAAIGSRVGVLGGGAAGVVRAQGRGYYKPEKK
jgi:hypothetical protein